MTGGCGERVGVRVGPTRSPPCSRREPTRLTFRSRVEPGARSERWCQAGFVADHDGLVVAAPARAGSEEGVEQEEGLDIERPGSGDGVDQAEREDRVV